MDKRSTITYPIKEQLLAEICRELDKLFKGERSEMIAKVIVDVPITQTNKPFDYLIPTKFESWIIPGMSVVVPFGPESFKGMLLLYKTHSDFDKLKEIEEMIDDAPVLTRELLN